MDAAGADDENGVIGDGARADKNAVDDSLRFVDDGRNESHHDDGGGFLLLDQSDSN